MHLEESGLSPAEIWCNESQERYTLAIAPGDFPRFQAMCERERAPFSVVGFATDEQQLQVVDRDAPADSPEHFPVNMPMDDVYSAMARGVIDGVVAPVDTFKVLHFDEVGRYFAALSVPRGGYPSRAIGDKAWQRLTPAQQALLVNSSGVWEAAPADEIEKGASAGRAAMAKAHIVVSPISPQEQARFDALYLQDAQVNARGLAEFGIDGLTVFRKARASVKGRDKIECGTTA